MMRYFIHFARAIRRAMFINMKKRRSYTYSIVLTPEPEGGYTVTVPALPEAITYGKTVDDALTYAREVIELSIKCRIATGEEVPVEFSPVTTSVVSVSPAVEYA